MAEKPYFHCGLQAEKSKLLGTTLLNEIVVIKTMIIVIIAILVVIIKIILVTMITVMQGEQSKRRSLDR